jgi:1-pyrroline-5-carboxylate dehydrogenase
LVAATESLTYGDVTNFELFGGAVIDRRAFDRLSGVLDALHADPSASVLAGGKSDDAVGYLVQPTVVEGSDAGAAMFRDEYFGPILAVHVYDDQRWHDTLTTIDATASYALTGAVFSRDRAAVLEAQQALRFTAGNFYVNDKPTGAVVGQQPFGGARASGTNDKAGSVWNLLRWVSPRAIKETFVAATDHRYPHMGTPLG